MTYASDTQALLELRVRATGWHIAQTVALGVVAACLAVFGQVCLDAARPIFPIIDQNYAAWQGCYTLVLLLIAVVWVGALLQKMSFLQDTVQRLRIQRRLDEQYALRAQKAEEARLAQRAALARAAIGIPAHLDLERRTRPAATATAGSSKFDY